MQHLKPVLTMLLILFCLTGVSSAQIYLHGAVNGVLEDTVYFVDGYVYVTDYLIIEPGATIYFIVNTYFEVDGTLRAVGTEEDTIKFMSAPGLSEWDGLDLWSSSDSSRLEYCYISGGACGISCGGGGSVISHCVITGNYGPGIEGGNCNTNISYCTITNNQGVGVGLYSAIATIAHCTISNNINSDDQEFGGGIRCTNGTNVTHCTITNNQAPYGGGILCNGSGVTVGYCTINGNYSTNNGGGIYCDDGSPLITNCDITENSAAYYGGGIFCGSSASPEINECNISDNWVNGVGGGIYCIHSTPSISNCNISGNSAPWEGGGICCLDSANLSIDHSVIWGNSSGSGGGGIACHTSGPTISNCTFSLNFTNGNGGGIYLQDNAFPTIVNCIIHRSWGSSGVYISSPSGVSITYCDVGDNHGANFLGDCPEGLGELYDVNYNGDSCDVFHNILLDPQLVNPNFGDFHLEAGSPCIDAGDPESPPDPNGTIADIGAYYYIPLSVPEEKPSDILPQEFHISQNYPNPFNSSTTIPYYLPVNSRISLVIYDITGRRIAGLCEEIQDAGWHFTRWDALSVASGVYFAKLQTEKQVATIKMVLLK
jgi:parallel beta-helix repeat protein/predicted outer membrane repeat protein